MRNSLEEIFQPKNLHTKFCPPLIQTINHIIYRNFGPNNSTSIVKEKKESRKAFQTKDNMSKPINIPLIKSRTTKKVEQQNIYLQILISLPFR
ncbi:hypothetical protein CEXT_90601 [Caerostris extrusa]|uniref:Uncharacterized protein n=1 Tax=Caerostris extrusa TaxID=172846 RepID=A0AAV4MJI4_CAEEX|nr:hypothetical protein CEXT_90601 [Caerostris extrusa]